MNVAGQAFGWLIQRTTELGRREVWLDIRFKANPMLLGLPKILGQQNEPPLSRSGHFSRATGMSVDYGWDSKPACAE